MTTAVHMMMLLLILLQVKHLFADYFLQTPRMLNNRSVYLHWGRLEHAALHGLFSFIVFIVIGAPLWFSVVLCLAEVVAHYHIDWIKGRYSDKTQHGPTDAGYWRAFGVDQLMHQLTYIAMIWIWAAATV